MTQARRNVWLTASIDVWHALKFRVDDTLRCCEIAADLCNHLLYHATFLGKQGSKEMLDLDLIMVVLPG
jgi:hypothetical protein